VKHLNPISRTPSPAQIFGGGGIDAIESLVLILFTVAFQGWDNFPAVIQNLQKYFAKT
jgi:hypothetical protein